MKHRFNSMRWRANKMESESGTKREKEQKKENNYDETRHWQWTKHTKGDVLSISLVYLMHGTITRWVCAKSGKLTLTCALSLERTHAHSIWTGTIKCIICMQYDLVSNIQSLTLRCSDIFLISRALFLSFVFALACSIRYVFIHLFFQIAWCVSWMDQLKSISLI